MKHPLSRSIASLLMLSCGAVAAFDSGSTGADGALAPSAPVTIPLPESGVLNYTSINIPAGVTVKFAPNARNTPVTLLVQGELDAFVPADDTQRLLRALPHARASVWAGAGHAMHWEEPARFAEEVVRFVSALEG